MNVQEGLLTGDVLGKILTLFVFFNTVYIYFFSLHGDSVVVITVSV